MSVKKTKYEIEIAVNPFRGGDGEEFDDTLDGNRGSCINDNVFFPPAGEVLRGAFDPSLLVGFSLSSAMQKFFETTRAIPGIHVWIDLQKGSWGTFDPLHEPETPALQRKLARVQEAMKTTFTNGREVGFAKPYERKLRTDDDVKNVLYWMACLVESRMAFTVTGSERLPSVDEIRKLPGRRDNTHGFRCQDKETRDSYLETDDYVPSETVSSTKK